MLRILAVDFHVSHACSVVDNMIDCVLLMEWLDHILLRRWKASAALAKLARMSTSMSDWLEM